MDFVGSRDGGKKHKSGIRKAMLLNQEKRIMVTADKQAYRLRRHLEGRANRFYSHILDERKARWLREWTAETTGGMVCKSAAHVVKDKQICVRLMCSEEDRYRHMRCFIHLLSPFKYPLIPESFLNDGLVYGLW